jgi:hypothetical protein
LKQIHELNRKHFFIQKKDFIESWNRHSTLHPEMGWWMEMAGFGIVERYTLLGEGAAE